jgi:hypothetical protein
MFAKSREIFSGQTGLRSRAFPLGNQKDLSGQCAVPLESWENMCDIKFNHDNLNEMCDGKGGEPRMGKKLVYLSGVTLFALTVSFAGCGKKEEPAPPPPPPPAPAPAEPTPPPAPDAAAPSGDQKAGEPAKDGAMEKKEEKTK